MFPANREKGCQIIANSASFVRQCSSYSLCKAVAYMPASQVLLHHWRMFRNAYFLGVFHRIV
jgi:hypothetical protein